MKITMLRLVHLRVRCRGWAYDRVRRSRVLAEASAVLLYALSIGRRAATETALALLVRALRRTDVRLFRRMLEDDLRPWVGSEIWRTARIGWSRYADEIHNRRMNKSLVLKPTMSSEEKGVLYVSFEYNLIRLLNHHDASRLLSEYILVVASSWSPPDYASLLSTARLSRDPLFVQISNSVDLEWLRVCAPAVRALPLMASDWINPNDYAPRPHSARDIDVLMVAGWEPWKGHRFLFQALRRMRENLRVVLIGQQLGPRTADDIFAEAKAFGVHRRIEIVANAPHRHVTDYQCRSRVSVQLSRREGSAVVVAESLFADAPVAMLRDAHVGSRAYINAQTGALTTPSRLHRDLGVLIERSASSAARAWAVEHISCFRSAARLNALLRDYAAENGQPWSRDIVPFCWRPDPVYVNNADRQSLQPEYRRLAEQHGLTFAGQTVDSGTAPA